MTEPYLLSSAPLHVGRQKPRTNDTESYRVKVASFGGGVNSTALLIGMHELGIRPDAILFADTGGEKPETYKHIDRMRKWCDLNGLPLINVVSENKTLETDCLDRGTLPGKAFGFGSCSEHFKIRPQRRWLAANLITNPEWLVGIHAGETRRAWSGATKEGEAISYPLISWGWDQAKCIEVCSKELGYIPVKSACFFCPAMRKPEVIQLAARYPDLFDRAVEMERNAKDCGNLQTVKGLGRRWSWEGLVAADDAQRKLFTDDQHAICDVCIDW